MNINRIYDDNLRYSSKRKNRYCVQIPAFRLKNYAWVLCRNANYFILMKASSWKYKRKGLFLDIREITS